MYVKPDALRMAAGLVEREWGSSGYAIERVEGSGPIAAVFVAHFDGSRFVIAANDMTGQWGHAEGEDDTALTAALHHMESAAYVDGRMTWPSTDNTCEACGAVTVCRANFVGQTICLACQNSACVGQRPRL